MVMLRSCPARLAFPGRLTPAPAWGRDLLRDVTVWQRLFQFGDAGVCDLGAAKIE